MTMTKRWYPSTPITPHGWWHLTHGTKPMMWLDAYDDSLGFHMLGGHAPPYHDPTAPEAVELKDLQGLIAPWKHITQKGATQDGVTHIDALLDPIEVQATVECVGRDWAHKARVVRDFIGSIDAIQQSRLNFLTLELGHWWSDIRWFQGAPTNALDVVRKGQPLGLRLMADTGLWSTYDNTDIFTFAYDSMTELFDVDHTSTQDLGDVPQHYTGSGGGYCTSNGTNMIWVDDPADPTTTNPRRVINGPWPDFDTDTDNQVVSQVHASWQETSLPESSRNIIGARMNHNVDGSWAGDGVFFEYGPGLLRLFYTVNFVETNLRVLEVPTLPILPKMRATLVAGYEGNTRMFKALINGLQVMSVKESGTGSQLGATHRGIGNGMYAAGALITQATPAQISTLSAGDNAAVTQQGFLKRVNVGDQKMYDDYTLFGPMTSVKIYDGPGSDEYVEFGPVLQDQIIFLRTDPRVNTTLVQDLTVTPLAPQQLNIFQQAIKSLLSFFSNGGGAAADQVGSLFGIKTPQGPLYKYLKGRFSDNCAIPPKSPGNDAQPYFVKVEMVGGNADSKVIVSGTPRRRYPL